MYRFVNFKTRNRSSLVAAAAIAAAAVPLGFTRSAGAQTFAVSMALRETGSVAEIGANGLTAGAIEFINIDGQSFVADGTWQQFTFNFGADPVSAGPIGTGNGMLDGTRGTLEHIRLRNSSGVTDTLTLWIDDLVNTVGGTPTVVSGFEPTDPFPATVGTEHVFQEPRFSGSTQPFLANLPNTTLVTDQQAHTGTQSNQADFAFNTSNPDAWLRLTTFNTPNQPNPTIDYSNGNMLSFWLRAVIAPPEQRWINPGSGNWDDPANWGTGVVPMFVGDTANFLEDITSAATVTLNNPVTVTTIRLQSELGYTIAGTNTLTLDGVAEDARTVNAQLGSHAISAPVDIVLSAGTSALATFNVQRPQDVLTISGDVNIAVFNLATLTIQKTGPGRMDVTNLETLDPVNEPTHLLVSGGTLRLLPGSGRTRMNSVTVAGGASPTARLDITDNPVVADYAAPDPSPLNSIRQQIAAAYNGGAWDGNGITSSSANATTHAIGYAEAAGLASVPALFGTVDADAVLLRLTRYGDSNLDGTVNLSDFNALAANFGQGERVWSQGDFTYDGTVNLSDFNRLAANFGLAAAGPEVTPADWAALASAVPEPGMFGLLSASAAAVLRRRRRACQAND